MERERSQVPDIIRSYSKVQHTGVTPQTAFSDEYRTYLVPQALTCVVLANA
ncbi:unnamed protein product [Penicillium camemberti]|uniref:Str. FM013 n=1 Tax=Penicillium camemberti (strain FM 013) TaxID=1429867 RepID=A0A0G4PT99_PENC3|nr:unnamed protein product [Penicillium camemberti]